MNFLQQNSKKNKDSSTGTECTLTNVEKLRIALDVVKGMRHLAERKVSWRYGEGQKVMFNSSKYYPDSELNWTGLYFGLYWTTR